MWNRQRAAARRAAARPAAAASQMLADREPVFAQKRLCCAKERGSPSDGAAVHARPSLSQPESRRAEQPLLSDACDLVAPPTRANGLARMSV